MSPSIAVVDAWRALIRRDGTSSRGLIVRRPSRLLRRDMPRCTELTTSFHVKCSDRTTSTRLGEVLRVVALATASHMDREVFSSLWSEDGMCTLGASLCTRCDGMEDEDAIISIQIQGNGVDGFKFVHGALIKWDENAASQEFVALRDALRGLDRTDNKKKKDPLVQIHISVSHHEEDIAPWRQSGAAPDLSDLRDLLMGNHDNLGRFQIARVSWPALPSTTPAFWPLMTLLANSGICMDLTPFYQPRVDRWQWLFSWMDRNKRQPPATTMTIVIDPFYANTIVRLLETVVATSTTLRELSVRWEVQSPEISPDTRQAIGKALGAALFGSSSQLRSVMLTICTRDLTEDVVSALGQGAAGSIDPYDSHDAEPRFRSVRWSDLGTSEAVIRRFVQLFGVVDIRELEMEKRPHLSVYGLETGPLGLSCHTLQTVLESCPGLKSLKWPILRCDDRSAFTGKWSSPSSQLRPLEVSFLEGDDPRVLNAMDVLFSRVGRSLVSLSISALCSPSNQYNPLSAASAEVIISRCESLRELEVTDADEGFYGRLAEAFDQGRCNVVNLSTESVRMSVGIELTQLLEALRNPRSGASRTLKSLQLGSGMAKPIVSLDAYADALLANSTLRSVVVWESKGLLVERSDCFDKAPRRFAVRLPSLRRRLALVSICGRSDTQHPATLPLSALEKIFEFSGRRIRRLEYRGRSNYGIYHPTSVGAAATPASSEIAANCGLTVSERPSACRAHRRAWAT